MKCADTTEAYPLNLSLLEIMWHNQKLEEIKNRFKVYHLKTPLKLIKILHSF